jgi:hypothetical protein
VSIFQGIDPNLGETSIRLAASGMLDRAEVLHLTSRRWSLAELEFDESDYEWLAGWSHALSDQIVRRCLSSWSDAGIAGRRMDFQAAVGLVFLALFSEVGRRHASEGWLWGRVIDVAFGEEPPASAFVQGQPSSLLKEALENAARAAGLRHMFGVEGVQNWFRSVYLQFGFTQSGFEQRLPEWLAGQLAPVSVESLLSSSDLHSDTFASLWHALANLRRKNISEEQCRTVLRTSCWVLPPWVDRLMAVARKRLDLGTATGERERDAGPPSFLSIATLRWSPPEAPAFVTQISNLVSFELQAPTYNVVIDGSPRATLLRQPDGLYHAMPSLEIALPFSGPIVQAELVDDIGTVAFVTDLRLWEPEEDVAVFKLPSGASVRDPTGPLQPSAEHAIITPADLDLRPEANHWCSSTDGQYVLRHLDGTWPSKGYTVVQADVEIWRPIVPGESRPVEPPWTIQVRVVPRLRRVRLGEMLEVDIVHPADVEIEFVRVEGRPWSFVSISESKTALDPLPVDADALDGVIKFKIGVCADGERLVLRKQTVVAPEGTAVRGVGGWSPLASTAVLDVQDARATIYRVFPPPADEGSTARDWGLIEGDTFLRRLTRYPSPLEGLSGLGGELSVRHGPYNSIAPPMTVAASVIDRGVVRNVSHGEGSPQFAIVLRGMVEPGDDHRVVWCDRTGVTYMASVDSSHVFDDHRTTVWTCETPSGATSPWAIAVAYEGDRLGAWWDDDWAEQLLVDRAVGCGEVAAMLRWLQLPILDSRVRHLVREFIGAHPKETAEAWVSHEHLPDGLEFRRDEDAWIDAVRKLLSDTSRDSAWLCALGGGLCQTAGTLAVDDLSRVAVGLTRVNPILMARVVFALVAKHLHSTMSGATAAARLKNLVFILAGCSRDAGEEQLDERLVEFTEQVASDMGVDRQFVKCGLVERGLKRVRSQPAGTDVDEVNIDLALGLDPFRRLLAIYALRDVVLPAITK